MSYLIHVRQSYVVLDYRDKEARESETLLISWFRGDNVDADKYIESRRTTNSVDIVINGNKAIKKEVYWDNEIWKNKYMCNQYYWVENGCAIFLRVPPWLLERYPEETFFHIQKYNIGKN